MSDPTKKAAFKIELVAVVDGGESLVKATYNLKGDEPLAFFAYEIVNTTLESIKMSHFSNVAAITR